MLGLIRTAAVSRLAPTALVAAHVAFAGACLACGCGIGPRTPHPEIPWKILDFQLLSDGSPCCPGSLGPALGILASNNSAMAGNTLKLAAGCRHRDGVTELGAVVEMRVTDPQGRRETFDALDLVTDDDCGDSTMSWGIATYRAIGHASRVWGVTSLPDTKLCDLLEDPGTERDLLLRALEESAVRRLCSPEVARLASSDDEDIVLRTVGTLGRIGAEASIETLGRLTLSRFTGVPWAAAHAIADIGGSDAVRALEIIAGQAATEELRREAAELAESLRGEPRGQ